eukprot:1195530-Prorocentrum_minimum.AAC.4
MNYLLERLRSPPSVAVCLVGLVASPGRTDDSTDSSDDIETPDGRQPLKVVKLTDNRQLLRVIPAAILSRAARRSLSAPKAAPNSSPWTLPIRSRTCTVPPGP